jgi:tRNA(Ile)-lysidine synthase
MSNAALIEHLQSGLARLAPGPIVVAISGGLDSTVLLHALASLAPARERGLRALHVDHGLHVDSAQWTAHCAAFAAQLGVPIDAIKAGPVTASGKGIEDAARAARYAAFAGNLRTGEVLAVAQHADDQAETVLLKLLRGAGPEGLGGMRLLREFAPGYLWRPLLELARAQLREYALAQGLNWIEDPSNGNMQLRRNFLRAEILPRLHARLPDAGAAIAHSARWAGAAADFIEHEAQRALARVQGVDPATLAWRAWLELPEALRDPMLRRWLRALGLDEPAHFHVAELERQLRDAAEDRSPCVSWEGSELRRYRDLLYAMPALAPMPAEWQGDWRGASLPLPDGGRLEWRPRDGNARATQPDAPALTVRYRRGGERLKPADTTHTRELRLLLQEAGIPPWQRDRIPLIHQNAQMIAVGDLILSQAGRELCDRLDARIVWSPGSSRAIDSASPLR